MKNFFNKVIKFIKNIGVFFLTTLVVYNVFSWMGLVKPEKMVHEYNLALAKLERVNSEIETVSFDSVYLKNEGRIRIEQNKLNDLNDKIISIQKEIDSLETLNNIIEGN